MIGFGSDNLHQIDGDAWCWFQDPRAIRHVGIRDKTYWGYVAKNGDITISSYDHRSQEIDTFTLRAALDVDDHAAPAILIRNDGRILVFYSKHNANTMYWRISVNPEDITAFGDELSFTGGGLQVCYPNPVQLAGEDNKIYLFYRKRTGESPTREREACRVSMDGGNQFGPEHDVIDVDNRTYVKVISNSIDKIHFCVTQGDGVANIHRNVYYCYYYNGHYYRADGEMISAPLPLKEHNLEKVYDSDTLGNYQSWIWDIALDSDGKPCIAFATFVSDEDHRYNYARWTGDAWETHEITTAGGCLYAQEPQYSGGISIDKDDTSIVYLSKVVSSQWEIQKYRTTDGGESWEAVANITFNSPKKNIRPAAIRNRSPSFPVFWMYGDYGAYTDYDTAISAKKASIFLGYNCENVDAAYDQDISREALFHDKSIDEQLANGMIPDIRRAVRPLRVIRFWDDPGIENICRGDVRALMIQRGSENKGRAMELGCGVGRLCLELARNGMDVVGIDISERRLEIAKNYYRGIKENESIGNITYVVADLNRIVFEERQYDSVIVWDTLHHLPAIEHVIKEVRKALKPGGSFLVLDYIGTSGVVRDLVAKVLYFILPTEASYSQKIRANLQRLKRPRHLSKSNACSSSAFEGVTGIEMIKIIKEHFTIKTMKTLAAFSLPLVQYIRIRDTLKYRAISFIKLLDDFLIVIKLVRGQYVFIWAKKEDG